MSMLFILSFLLPFVGSFFYLKLKRFYLPFLFILFAPSFLILILSHFIKNIQFSYSSFLLKGAIGLDNISEVFLFFTVIIWLISGIFANFYFEEEKKKRIFFFYFFLTFSGNVGLILASDMVLFVAMFSLMTFASYGLIVIEKTKEAIFASKVYIWMAIIGELFITAALMIGYFINRSTLFSELIYFADKDTLSTFYFVCVMVGFGVKAGIFMLHMWLVLAHPAAPYPASAVLSGVMIKAGLLGWLRFLPPFTETLIPVVIFFTYIGIVTYYYAVFMGIFQKNIKVLLAYSSMSQMGLILLAFLGSYISGEHMLTYSAVLIFALHHSFTKAGLFLGVRGFVLSEHKRGNIVGLVCLIFLSLSLAGFPFSSGAVAKVALKDVAHNFYFIPFESFLLSITGITSTLLMGRFLYLFLKRKSMKATNNYLFILSVVMTLFAAFIVVFMLYFGFEKYILKVFTLSNILSSLLYITIGALISLYFYKKRIKIFIIGAGDIIYPLLYILKIFNICLEKINKLWFTTIDKTVSYVRDPIKYKNLGDLLLQIETVIRKYETFGFFYLLIFIALCLLSLLTIYI